VLDWLCLGLLVSDNVFVFCVARMHLVKVVAFVNDAAIVLLFSNLSGNSLKYPTM